MKNLKRDHPCACEIVTTDKYFEPNFKFIAELMQYTLHVVKLMRKQVIHFHRCLTQIERLTKIELIISLIEDDIFYHLLL